MHRRSIVSAILIPVAFLSMALAAPTLVAAGGGCHGAISPPGDGESSVIKIDGCMFSPTIARVPVGTTVRFLNTGDVPHNITGVVGSWASPVVEPGGEFQQAFAAPGVYPFACTLHPGMNGAIVVGGDQDPVPAAAVTPQAAADDRPVGDLGALATAALLGLVVGIGSGVGVTRLRRRTTA